MALLLDHLSMNFLNGCNTFSFRPILFLEIGRWRKIEERFVLVADIFSSVFYYVILSNLSFWN
jgi:hypothetical protein